MANMEARLLGKTNLRISAVAFGAGPAPALLVSDDRQRQTEVVAEAIACGINWFDTAPTYGNGASEAALGAALAELRPSNVHVASKVRIPPEPPGDLREYVLGVVRSSLERLGIERLTLLQLHNAITLCDNDQPSSVCPQRVLGTGGILDAMEFVRQEGLCEHLGLTGIGAPAALAEAVSSERFASVQMPFSLVQPSAGYFVRGEGIDNYDGLFPICEVHGVGVLAIRVFAGGAIAGQPPSEHTKRTPYFPLDVYERDRRRAEQVAAVLPEGLSINEAAARFAIHHAAVSSAIVGMASVEQVRELVRYADAGPLAKEVIQAILAVVRGERN
jgi:aryl-alcohol dehydrogenase-like predicted oxidoreductase